jgi:hypothetical protein
LIRPTRTVLPLLSVLLVSGEAEAVRFTLGVAGDLTPVVIESDAASESASGVRFGLIPVLEVEASPYLSVGTYTPFTLVRARGGTGPGGSSGAESIFGLQAAGRYPLLRDESPEEVLLYGVVRGGFATVEARAGPFYGFGLGAAATWLETGWGTFFEISMGRLVVDDRLTEEPLADRWFVGATLGCIFRLGGESWYVAARD